MRWTMQSPAEVQMRSMLEGLGVPYQEQRKVAGHSIDFVIDVGTHLVLIDPNGDRWHRWSKVRACDHVKLNRVLGADPLRTPEKPCIPLGVWWSRIQKDPASVIDGIDLAIRYREMAFWDWAVDVDLLEPIARRNLMEVLDGVG